MSVATNRTADLAAATPAPSKSGATSGFSSASWLAIACVVLGCLPATYAHFVNLLSKPHYQHIALVPLGIWAIWRQDLHRLSRSFSPLHWAPLACLLLGAAALGVAARAGSPWIGMVATLILLLPCLWWRGGWSAWKRGWRGWLFAWTLVPLPLGMDEDLTLWLRTITTKLTSRVLDELGVLHLSYANVIELPGKPLFVADACSGINSLYVLMAAALFFAMWSGRTLLHTVLLLGATFYWVMVENVARLSLVALAWQRQMDWSQGTAHTWLGVVLFVISLALVLSTDQFLQFLIPGGKVRVGDYFRKNAYYYYGGDEYFKDPAAAPTANPTSPASATGAASWLTAVCLSAPLPLIGLFQLAHFPSAIVPTFTQADATFDDFGAAALPESLGGFQRTDYTTIQRVEGDPMGRDSQQWTYRRGPVTLRVSVDYPYDGVHDLLICYEAIGWRIDEQRIAPPQSGADAERALSGPVGIGVMQRPLYGHALLFFSSADNRGELHTKLRAEAIGDVDTRRNRRWNAMLERPTQNAETATNSESLLPYIQFHMLVQGEHPFDLSQQSELLATYDEFRGRLLPLVLSGASTSPKSQTASPPAQPSSEEVTP